MRPGHVLSGIVPGVTLDQELVLVNNMLVLRSLARGAAFPGSYVWNILKTMIMVPVARSMLSNDYEREAWNSVESSMEIIGVGSFFVEKRTDTNNVDELRGKQCLVPIRGTA